MIDDYILGQMILTVFLPVVPAIAGFVLAFLTALLLYSVLSEPPTKGN